MVGFSKSNSWDIDFFILSGSEQARVTMPIMFGLTDLSGVTRQAAVFAFLLGDGFWNTFYLTSGNFMATSLLGDLP